MTATRGKPTVGLFLHNLRPHGQSAVDEDEPEADQWDKVIELVGSVHHHTQQQHQEVEPEEHLQHKGSHITAADTHTKTQHSFLSPGTLGTGQSPL